MAKEEEIPRHRKSMDAIIKSSENISTIIDTVAHDHGKTYYDTAEEVLRNDKGQIDYKRLDPEKNGDKYHKLFAKKMSEKYLDKIVKKLKINPKDFNQEELDQMTHGFFGVNEGLLLNMLAQHGENFTHETYKEKHIKEHLKGLDQSLSPRIYAHISAEDIPKILKEIGADKFLRGDPKDYAAKPEFRPGVASLVQTHHSRGSLSHKDIANNPYFASFYKKPEHEIKYAVPLKKAA